MQSLERRLPFYLLLDTSESMVGEPLNAVEQGLKLLCADLKNDPTAIETAWLSVITFSRHAHRILPLTEVLNFNPPKLTVGPGTCLGEALDLLVKALKTEVRTSTPTQKGDWKPIVFLLTDGMPTDDWQTALKRFKTETARMGLNIIAVGCGEEVDVNFLRQVTPSVLLMKNATAGDFKAFFKWVSTSVSRVSVGVTNEGKGVEMPAPPGSMEFAGGAPTGGVATGKPPTQYILAARCRDSKKGYLMRYRKTPTSGETYQAEDKGHPVDDDYFSESMAGPAGQTIDSSKLKGAPACPHCQRKGWAPAKDGPWLECSDTLQLGGSRAQVMFVLDVTGSMGSEIDGVKENIKDFMDYVKDEGLDAEIGLIAFRDLEEDEEPQVLEFGEGEVFTKDSAAFKKKVSKLYADGGGDNPGESSLDALVLACRQTYREDATRILILITDEPPLIPDGQVRSLDDVVKAMQRAGIDQLHMVLPDPLRRCYAALQREVKGEIFPLQTKKRGGNSFRKVLLDIGKSISVTTRLG